METTPSIFATFSLDGQSYAMDIRYVREAVNYPESLSRYPGTKDAVLGLIHLRQQVIPLISLAPAFALKTQPNPSGQIAILNFEDKIFGLLFDRIQAVVRLDDTVRAEYFTDSHNPYVSGILHPKDQSQVIQILDVVGILSPYRGLSTSDSDHEHAAFTKTRTRKQAITFTLNQETYALDMLAIREIIKVPDIQRKLILEDYIKGIALLRGEVVTVIDLNAYLRFPAKDMPNDARLIILRGQEKRAYGILVDSVTEIISYDETQVYPIPTISTDDRHQGLVGVIDIPAHAQILLIEPEKLFSQDKVIRFEQNLKIHAQEIDATVEAALQQNTAKSTKEDAIASCQTEVEQVFVTFEIDDIYATKINSLQQILTWSTDIKRIPNQAEYFEGILKLREEVIPIINLRRYYHLPDFDNRQNSKILIAEHNGHKLGLMVNDVQEIVRANQMATTHLNKLFSLDDGRDSHIHQTVNITTRSGERRSLILFDSDSFIDSFFKAETNAAHSSASEKDTMPETKQDQTETSAEGASEESDSEAVAQSL